MLVLGSWLAAASVSAQLPARWPRAPLTEVARAQVGADVAAARYGVSGRDATLCVIDTGVDPARFGDRIAWTYDALGAPRGEHAELEARFGGAVGGPAFDRHGHGTAMASIALALAPDARVIVARAWNDEEGGFLDEDVLRAARFCRAVAAEDPSLDGRRLVILVSLGGHDGTHDGEGAFERALEAEAATPIVVAAGNDGDRPIRATGRVLRGETARVDVHVPTPAVPDAWLGLTLDFDAEHPSAFFAIAADDGTRSPELRDSGPQELFFTGLTATIEPMEGRADVARILFSPTEGGTHAIEVHGPATFELWLAATRLGPTFFAPSLGGASVSDAEQIAVPATARRLISVGATVSRESLEGRIVVGDPGDVAPFSAHGPTVNGIPKPDLVAPGGWIAATLSTQLSAGDPENLLRGRDDLVTDDRRVAVRGTSASAAVVAGALLLALELAPTIGPDARAHLVASAGDATWTAKRGWGELDVERLLAHVRGELAPTTTLIASRVVTPSDPLLWLSARGRFDVLEVELDGRVHTARAIRDHAELALPLRRPIVGEPIGIRAWADGVELTPLAVPVVLDRSPRTPRIGGGGCGVGGRSDGLALPLVLALIGLGARSRRERRGRRCP